MMDRILLAAALGLPTLAGCASCRPDLPDPDSDDTDVLESDTEVPDSADTGPVPVCGVTESEPNPIGDPDDLPLEVTGCGELGAVADSDAWAFALPEAGWIRVRVDARALSSRADPIAILSGAGGAVALEDRADGGEDVFAQFPSPAGAWTAVVSDELQAGGADFPYRILVGTAKAPTSWAAEEAEPNDSGQDAADSVFGTIDPPRDRDRFRVVVPFGRFRLRAVAEAGIYGSPADLELALFNEAGDRVAAAAQGSPPALEDPVLEYTSSGNETLTVEVRDQRDRGGPALWYVLRISQESLE